MKVPSVFFRAAICLCWLLHIFSNALVVSSQGTRSHELISSRTVMSRRSQGFAQAGVPEVGVERHPPIKRPQLLLGVGSPFFVFSDAVPTVLRFSKNAKRVKVGGGRPKTQILSVRAGAQSSNRFFV